jgi:PBP1b-binding outer membrane lipoprotein LpoB
MKTRRISAVLAALLLFAGCGASDAKDAVSGAKDNAAAAVDDAKAGADKAADAVAVVKALSKADKKLAAHPDEVLAAAKKTCAFMETHKNEAARVEEVRTRFDRLGATELEAAKARAIVKILNTQVCPRLK